jgi:predicted DNA-binding transcriptional regulator AlpA
VTTSTPDLFDALADRLADKVAGRVIAGIAEVLPPSAEPWRLLSVDEVAARLGRSRRSVFGYITYAELPVVHLDRGSVRIDPDDLREWCRERRIPAAESTETACTPLATRMDKGIRGRNRITNPSRTGGSR